MKIASVLVLLIVLLRAERAVSVPYTKEKLPLVWKEYEQMKDVAEEPVVMDPIPDHVDWRDKGVVPAVSNEGQVGQAVAFALTHAIDAYWAIKSGQLIIGSVTELVECCMKIRNVSVNDAYSCVVRIGGLASDDDYPSNTSGKCLYQLHKPVIFINGHRDVEHFDEKALAAAVATTPVVALVDASRMSFLMYKSGIFSDHDCSSTKLDHALLVVGYGTMDGNDYWLCQNSWGTSWGMDGYIMIARNAGNMCGIATLASYPI